MKQKLTAKFVEGVKPTAKRQVFVDSLSRNLNLIVQPTGKKVWCWLGSYGGKNRSVTLGTFPRHDLAAARAWADEINEGRVRGDPFPESPRKLRKEQESAGEAEPSDEVVSPAKTVDWLWDLYVEKEGPTLKASTLAERKRCYTNHIKPSVGSMLIHEVHRNDLVKILRAKEEAGFPALSNNLCAYIRRLFRWAVTAGFDLTGLETDPAANLIKLAPPSERDRFLSDDEIKFFFQSLSVLDESFAEALTVALYTGMRRSEVFGLQWSEVMLEDRWLDIRKERIKNGLPLLLPLPDTLIDLLSARKQRTGNFAFVWPAMKSWSEDAGDESDETKVVNNFSRPMKRLNAECQKLAKAEGKSMASFTIHDLRRTLSSGMHALKDANDRSLVPTDIVERVINHTIQGVRGTYNRHDYRVEKREALNHWAQHLNKIRLDALAATARRPAEASEECLLQ